MSDEDIKLDEETMHPAVLLLLARMKSNPQDFRTPFHESHSHIWKFFNKAEKAAVSAADREITLEKFHSKLMKDILEQNDPDKGVALNSMAQQQVNPQLRVGLANNDINTLYQNILTDAFNQDYKPPTLPTPAKSAGTVSPSTLTILQRMKFGGKP